MGLDVNKSLLTKKNAQGVFIHLEIDVADVKNAALWALFSLIPNHIDEDFVSKDTHILNISVSS